MPLLPGCGFTPIYAEGTAARGLNGSIELGEVNDRMDFDMREQLEIRLGRPEAPVYRLDVMAEVDTTGQAITKDAAITRYNLSATATYTLTPIGGTVPVVTDTVRSFTAYNATATVYSTYIADRDARHRLAVTLADQIATRIAAEASGLPR